MRRLLLATLCALAAPTTGVLAEDPATEAATASLPEADELLGYVDDNLTYTTRAATITMEVVNPRRTRTYSLRTFGRGQDEAAIEYLAPARDKGTKMLRMGDKVWTFLPTVERTQKISGHMLRKGLMGSDLSYEDMMGATKLRDAYDAEVLRADTLDGTAVWLVELTAKDDGITYPRRLAWIAQDTRVPLKQELYAVSGMKLKTWTMGDIESFEGGRRFPTQMVITDHLKEGTATTLHLDALQFEVEVPEETFSLRWLER